MSGNGALILTPELLALYTPIATLLAQANLSVATIDVGDLITTIGGRTFLHYVVKCALPEGEEIVTNVLGVQHSFPGKIGLAPEWRDAPLSTSGKRWVSACLLAHVNLLGASVPILVAGNHPALTAGPSTSGSGFTLREGAFYGNIFNLVPKMHACTGEDTLPSRVCANGILGLSTCGFTVPGNCRSTAGNVCGSDVAGSFRDCRSGLILPLLPTTNYPETITVYLQEPAE